MSNKVVRDEPIIKFNIIIISIIITVIFTVLKLFDIINWNAIFIILPLIIGIVIKAIELLILAIKLKFRK